MQVTLIFESRTVVGSSGGSWPKERAAPMRPAAPVAESVARNRRRFCVIFMVSLLGRSGIIDRHDGLVRASECHGGEIKLSCLSSCDHPPPPPPLGSF